MTFWELFIRSKTAVVLDPRTGFFKILSAGESTASEGYRASIALGQAEPMQALA